MTQRLGNRRETFGASFFTSSFIKVSVTVGQINWIITLIQTCHKTLDSCSTFSFFLLFYLFKKITFSRTSKKLFNFIFRPVFHFFPSKTVRWSFICLLWFEISIRIHLKQIPFFKLSLLVCEKLARVWFNISLVEKLSCSGRFKVFTSMYGRFEKKKKTRELELPLYYNANPSGCRWQHWLRMKAFGFFNMTYFILKMRI